MLVRPSPLQVPDRPSKYLRVQLDGDLELVFRLPNEMRQLQLLRLVAARCRQDGGLLQIVGSLDTLAAVVGVCWYHPTLGLETPLPWHAADEAARRAAQAVPEPSEDTEADEDGAHDMQAVLDASEAAQDEARWDAMATYGESVLDELDEAGWGDRNTVGACFAELARTIGANFLPEEAVDERLGFIGAQRASVG